MSAKFLLVRTGSSAFYAQALVVTVGGVYLRPLANEAEFAGVIQTEKFDLIVCDGRGKESALLELTQKIRSHQNAAHIILVCEKPPLDFVVKAIRLGVRDLFPAPVNLGELLSRADELVKPFFAGGGGVAFGNCRSSLTLFLTGDATPAPTGSAKGGSAPDAKELTLLRDECARLGRELQSVQESHNLAAATSVSRNQDIEAREQALAEMESALALDKNKQLAEQESVKLIRAELAQSQVSLEKAGSDQAEREHKLAQQLASLAQAQQAHEDALAEFEVNEQMLVAREKALAAERTKFAEAQKSLLQAQAQVAQESAELLARRTVAQGEWDALAKAQTELQSAQTKLTAELARIEADADGLEESQAELAAQVADLAKRTQGVVSREQALKVREGALSEAEARAAQAESAARAAVPPLMAQAEQLTAALAAREKALAAKEKEVAKVQARIEADAAAIEEEQATLAAAKSAFDKTRATLADREAKLEAAEKLQAEQLELLKKELATVKNTRQLVEADRQALEAEHEVLAGKVALFEKKRQALQAMISSG